MIVVSLRQRNLQILSHKLTFQKKKKNRKKKKTLSYGKIQQSCLDGKHKYFGNLREKNNPNNSYMMMDSKVIDFYWGKRSTSYCSMLSEYISAVEPSG